MFSRFLLVAILLGMSLSACVSTRALGNASQLPPEQRVTLIETAKHFGIYKVDGDHRGYGAVKSFQITPGRHTIHFTGGTGGGFINTFAEGRLTYTFEPGHTYYIDQDSTGGAFAVRIIDGASRAELVPEGGP